MKNKLKKINTFILSLFVLLPTYSASAHEEDTLRLMEEGYSEQYIYRIYHDVNNQEEFVTIDIPEELQKTIKKSKDPLLEAKKYMAYLFLSIEDDKRMKELNNEWTLEFDKNYHYAIDKNLEKKFNEEKKVSIEWANKMIKEKGELDLKQKIETYDKMISERVQSTELNPDLSVVFKKNNNGLESKEKVIYGGGIFLILLLMINFIYKRIKR